MRKMFIIFALMFAFLLGACCTVEVEVAQDNPIKIWPENENGPYRTICVVDEETGVNYIATSIEAYGRWYGIAITPRLNADGSLYVNEK